MTKIILSGNVIDQYIIFYFIFLKQHRSDERVPKASGSPVSCSAQCLSASSLVMVKSSGSSSFHLLTLQETELEGSEP